MWKKTGVIESRRMRWAWHVAGMWYSRGVYRDLARRKLRERHHL